LNTGQRNITVKGARTHNLKNVDISIPRDAMTVIAGPSGSGKSSLAFDTLYAEGQRRYVESLSTYARQFLEQLQKPDVDQIDGLPPTVAIEQRAGSSNPRSTVATTTEVYDYLRALFARVGTPHCWDCDAPIERQEVAEIVDRITTAASGGTAMILAPIVRSTRGSHAEVLERLRKEGLVRIRLDGKLCRLDDDPKVPGNACHDIEAVVDRLKITGDISARLADSLEYALQLGEGIVQAVVTNEDKTSELLFSSKFVCPAHPDNQLPELSPRLFSFNSPIGACTECEGLGTILEFDAELVVPDANLSMAQGAIDPWRANGKQNTRSHARAEEFCEQFDIEPEAPFRNLPQEKRKICLFGTTRKDTEKYGASFEGIIPELQRRWEKTTSESIKQKLHAYLSEACCPACNGSRLNAAARAVHIAGNSIDEVVALNITSALEWINSLSFEGEDAVIAPPLLSAIEKRLAFMTQVGVGYLTLDRRSASLSGGEAQRIRLATQVGTGLVGVCYVLDEPTIGLHPRDTRRLVGTLEQLRDLGNTVIVVEHDEATIRAADFLVDIGPGAGARGGQVIAAGTFEEILGNTEAVTGQYLSGAREIALPEARRTADLNRTIEIRGATENNLKNINVRIPLGILACVTGVSGSGKSTLVNHILVRALRRKLYGSRDKPGAFDRLIGAHHVDKVIQIDQTPIGRSPRSNPATYVGVFDQIRQLYARTREAKIRGYSPSRFSFNVKGGRCENCQGQGTKRIEMHFLPDVFVTCESCKGTRYNRETLEIRYRGKNIADVLDMRVDDAKRFFNSFSRITQLLQSLSDVGMSYITLGQASNTLSGGEAQRVKLAGELGRSQGDHTLYILDEPTTGLHYADIEKLLNVLNRLVDQGNTVLVIEHNLEVLKVSDWIIDLGPEGGDHGGTVVSAGPPEEVADHDESHTGRFLRALLDRQTLNS
jgi:excinuclease ABC subunit A